MSDIEADVWSVEMECPACDVKTMHDCWTHERRRTDGGTGVCVECGEETEWDRRD